MSVHWVDAIAPLVGASPEERLEEALAVHGWQVVARQVLPNGGVGQPFVPGTLRWRHLQLEAGLAAVWVSDVEAKLGRAWWMTLSVLLDGFVVGYEKWDYQGVNHMVLALAGVALEDRELALGEPDARTWWDERCAFLFNAYSGSHEDATLLHTEDWWLAPAAVTPAPIRHGGGRALFANVTETQFRTVTAGDQQGWRYRPWVSQVGVPALDLWHPQTLDLDLVRQWAAALDCIAVAWTLEGAAWLWAEFVGRAASYQGTTDDPVALIKALQSGVSAVGEVPAVLGGRGLKGWHGS